MQRSWPRYGTARRWTGQRSRTSPSSAHSSASVCFHNPPVSSGWSRNLPPPPGTRTWARPYSRRIRRMPSSAAWGCPPPGSGDSSQAASLQSWPEIQGTPWDIPWICPRLPPAPPSCFPCRAASSLLPWSRPRLWSYCCENTGNSPGGPAENPPASGVYGGLSSSHPLAHGNELSPGPWEIENTDIGNPLGILVFFPEDRFYDIRVSGRVLPYDIGRPVRGRIVVNQDFVCEIRFLHQEPVQGAPYIWGVVVGDAADTDRGPDIFHFIIIHIFGSM